MMLFSYKKSFFLILSITILLLITSCSPLVEEDGSGAVSNSTSSSETGDGFILQPKSSGGAYEHAASIVIGQSSFRNNGDEEPSANSISLPYGNPTVVDNELYLPDFGNNRILGYTTVPTTDGKNADFVVGQNIFIDNLSGSTEYRNRGMQTSTVVDGKLFVTDWDNSRILIYNKRPIGEPAKADIVVGQTEFGLSDAGISNNRLNRPESLYAVDNKLIVADSENNRVLIWNSIPTSNGAVADIVLGQSNFNTRTVPITPTASSLNFPTAVWSDGTYLAVLDAKNNRVLVWNNLNNINSGDDANTVLGQDSFDVNQPNQGVSNKPTLSTLNFTDGDDRGGLYANRSQLFVADSGNHRVMIWDYPLTDQYNQAAIGLIGQDSANNYWENRGATGDNPDCNDDTLSYPTGVYQFDDKLIVTDTGNNRYLIFNSATP